MHDAVAAQGRGGGAAAAHGRGGARRWRMAGGREEEGTE